MALLGSVAYYSRFGFVAAHSIGVIPPDPAWQDHFQVRSLHAWRPGVRGVFRIAPPFDDL